MLDDPTIHRTPARNCSACEYGTRHTPADWLHHPDAGRGSHREHGTTQSAPSNEVEKQEMPR
jgi:hypothetical protein